MQLATITAGILIALSLEGVRESFQHRALVREARENIRREMADNQREVDGELAGVAVGRKRLEAALEWAQARLATKKTEIHELNVNFSLAELSSANWLTAERTGALSLMDYAEVQRYAKVYNMQELYSQQQLQAVEHVAATGILFVGFGDPDADPLTEVEVFRDHVRGLIANLAINEQLGHRISELYKKTLEEQ